jgi:hypothetical protein
MIGFRHRIVNTLHKGDNKNYDNYVYDYVDDDNDNDDDDDDDDNNKNINNRRQRECGHKISSVTAIFPTTAIIIIIIIVIIIVIIFLNLFAPVSFHVTAFW